MRWLRTAFYAAVLACTGCASITTGEFQAVTVNARGLDGAVVDKAECKLSNDKGFWSVLTPAVANVSRSGSALNVACTKSGEPAGSVMAISRIHGGMVGNVIFGGLIGVVIDHASGSGYEYPDRVDVVMGKALMQDRKDQNAADQTAASPTASAIAAAATPSPAAPTVPPGPRTPVTGNDLVGMFRSLGKVSIQAPSQVLSMDFQPDGTVVVDFANATRRGFYKITPGDSRLCMKFNFGNEVLANAVTYLSDCFTVYRVADGHFVMRAANSDFEVQYQKPGAVAGSDQKSVPAKI